MKLSTILGTIILLLLLLILFISNFLPENLSNNVAGGIISGVIVSIIYNIASEKERNEARRIKETQFNFFIWDTYNEFESAFFIINLFKKSKVSFYEDNFDTFLKTDKSVLNDFINEIILNSNEQFSKSWITKIRFYMLKTEEKFSLMGMQIENENKLKKLNTFILALKKFQVRSEHTIRTKKTDDLNEVGSSFKEMAINLHELFKIANNESYEYLEKYQPPYLYLTLLNDD